MQLYSLIASDIAAVEKEMGRLLQRKPKETYSMLLPFIQNGGKRLRPALLLLCCRALQGNKRHAIRLAAILEMFHNFSLIHDDMADNSMFRRGTRTLHRQYGIGIALNSGDALYTLVWNALLEMPLPTERRIVLARLCGATFQQVTEGQGEELAWYRENRFAIRERDYFRMVGGKTASLIGMACQAGGFLADATPQTQHRLYVFGERLGLAFQIQDDVLNITGTFQKYKKKIGEDITEGKRTLMVIQTMTKATPKERQRLVHILSSHTRNPKRIAYVISLFRKYRALEYAQQTANRLVHQARQAIRHLPKSREKEALHGLVRFVIEREQ